MTDNVENLILEMLKGLRSEVQTLRSEMHEGFAELKHRLTGVETSVTKARGDNLGTQEDVYRQQAAIDRLAARIERVEKRLELTASP